MSSSASSFSGHPHDSTAQLLLSVTCPRIPISNHRTGSLQGNSTSNNTNHPNASINLTSGPPGPTDTHPPSSHNINSPPHSHNRFRQQRLHPPRNHILNLNPNHQLLHLHPNLPYPDSPHPPILQLPHHPRNLQPSPPRLPYRPARAPRPLTRTEEPPLAQGRLREDGYHEAQEAQFRRAQGRPCPVEFGQGC